ncbi:MAG: hypothetical protein HYU88_07065 [Chloroflexi bacterium]|nr:hypothetical protein [Chloroflexota bacterium]
MEDGPSYREGKGVDWVELARALACARDGIIRVLCTKEDRSLWIRLESAGSGVYVGGSVGGYERLAFIAADGTVVPARDWTGVGSKRVNWLDLARAMVCSRDGIISVLCAKKDGSLWIKLESADGGLYLGRSIGKYERLAFIAADGGVRPLGARPSMSAERGQGFIGRRLTDVEVGWVAPAGSQSVRTIRRRIGQAREHPDSVNALEHYLLGVVAFELERWLEAWQFFGRALAGELAAPHRAKAERLRTICALQLEG